MNSRLKKGLAPSLALLTLIGVGAVYFHHHALYPSTEDAYVKAHVVTITPKVSGTVTTIAVQENQFVRRGELLLTIEDTPYQLAVAKAQADLEHVNDQIRAADLNAQAAEASVKEAQAELTQVQAEHQRMMALMKQGYISRSQGDASKKNLVVAENRLSAARSQLQRALQERGAAGDDNANLKAATAALHQAQLNLSYTKLSAPCDGYVSNLDIRQGDVLTAYQPLFSIVERQHLWVEANFKETDLKRIRAGQPVDITLDMYPGLHWTGTVSSLSYNSTSSFSLLPAENASANWVKVTQRFPVRIDLPDNRAEYPLRLGASATATVDTR